MPNPPNHARYRDFTTWAPCVYAVDDAWFEGESGGALFDNLRLGGIHDQRRALTRLRDHIDLRRNEVVTGTSTYLAALVAQCLESGFHLVLCNFEWLEENWQGEVNQKGHALLLDINYAQRSGGADVHYGLTLIRDLLRDEAPQADICIVSGFIKVLEDAIAEHRQEGAWWSIRGFQRVEKRPGQVAADLAGFAANLAHKNQKPPDVELMRSLVRAVDEGWGHPHRPGDVPADLPMRARYAEDLGGIKALYHGRQRNKRVADYRIGCSTVTALLETAGYPFAPAPAQAIHLPWSPYGVLWLVKVWTLLRAMEAERSPEDTAEFRVDARGAQIVVPLNPRYAQALDDAVNSRARKGAAADAFEDLKSNGLKIATELLARMRPEERRTLEACMAQVRQFDLVFPGIEHGAAPVLVVRWGARPT